MIKLACPDCGSKKIFFVSSELNHEDCFECEECNSVFPFTKAEWEAE